MSDPAALDACRAELEALLSATGASRTTLRLARADGWLPVVAEARTDGVGTLVDQNIDVRASETFQAVARDRGLLVQDDLRTAEPPAPAELIERYGALAQMLAPLERDGEVVGVISVHEAKGVRAWTQADRGALTDATARVAAVLGLRSGARPTNGD